MDERGWSCLSEASCWLSWMWVDEKTDELGRKEGRKERREEGGRRSLKYSLGSVTPVRALVNINSENGGCAGCPPSPQSSHVAKILLICILKPL